MSLEVRYKGRGIASLSGDADCALKTAGKYCEGDISLTLRETGGGRLYTNAQTYAASEQITDVSGFTLLYDSTKPYGANGQKVAARLAITNESSHSAMQAQGWNAYGNAYYDTEYQMGAYGGYNFRQEIHISKAKFWLGRFAGQNITLTATAEYLDANGNWNEICDMKIYSNLDYPAKVFEVNIGRNVYGIRWIHKKEPQKSGNNNITFSGMSIYRGVGTPIDVYRLDSTGIIMPPNGYDGFGPLLLNVV